MNDLMFVVRSHTLSDFNTVIAQSLKHCSCGRKKCIHHCILTIVNQELPIMTLITDMFDFTNSWFVIISAKILRLGKQVSSEGRVTARGGNGNGRKVLCSKPSLHCHEHVHGRALYKRLTKSSSDTAYGAT